MSVPVDIPYDAPVGTYEGPAAVCGIAAGICTGWTGTPEAALRGALSCGHESVVEHASFTFLVENVSRVLLAQLTRHRIASFCVESQRYTLTEPHFVIPKTITDAGLEDAYRARCIAAWDFYNAALEHGIPKEDARYILPEGTTCKLVVTMNARELRHFFALRMCNRAQWEIRSMAEAMFIEAYKAAPALFGKDCGPGCCTRTGCPEGKKSCGHDRKDDLEKLKNKAPVNKVPE